VRFGFGLEAKPVEWSICRQWRAQRGFCCRGGAVLIWVQSPLRWGEALGVTGVERFDESWPLVLGLEIPTGQAGRDALGLHGV
jgi:hypothetical protein